MMQPSFSKPDFGPRVLAGRYRLDSMISRSGVGEVHLATQLGLDRKVAVKLMRKHRDSEWPALVKRLTHEATVLARLNHVNVVTLHDFGETDTGDFFLTMEYLDGRSLDKVVETDGPLPFETVIKVAVQIARALREAHAVGVIHRDLTAGDVFLVRGADEADHSHVKVLDFGLATTGPTGVVETEELGEQMIGSPSFTSPEQIYGEGATERSDLYSFGVILYLMLTGKVPFGGVSTAEILRSQLKDLPPPPALMGYRRKIPRALEELTMRCLEKDPEARIPTAKDLIVALKAVYWAIDPTQTVDGLPKERGRSGEWSMSETSSGMTVPSADLPLPLELSQPPVVVPAPSPMLTPPPVAKLSPISPVPAEKLQALTPLAPPVVRAPPPRTNNMIYAAPALLVIAVGAWLVLGRSEVKVTPPPAPVVTAPVEARVLEPAFQPAGAEEAAAKLAPPEPARVIEPKVIEPKVIEPRVIEPKVVETQAERRARRAAEKAAERAEKAEKKAAAMVAPEPAKVEAKKIEPTAKVEPARVEPAKVEPAKVEPAKVEPAKVAPVAEKAPAPVEKVEAPVEAPKPVAVAPAPKPAAPKAAAMVPPQPLKNVLPVYPPRYLSMGYASSVTVKVSIDAEGTPTDVEVVEGSQYPEFDFAAKKAALRERYSPATKDGVPVPYVRTARYNFSAPR